MKVRGNAAHVAEKYLQLARDAQSSGDRSWPRTTCSTPSTISASSRRPSRSRTSSATSSASRRPRSTRTTISRPSTTASRRPSRVPALPAAAAAADEQQQPSRSSKASRQRAGRRCSRRRAAADGAGRRRRWRRRREGDGRRRHRDRRPRRRGRGGAGCGEGGADPADAPQPDVGELPAFLTAGNPTARRVRLLTPTRDSIKAGPLPGLLFVRGSFLVARDRVAPPSGHRVSIWCRRVSLEPNQRFRRSIRALQGGPAVAKGELP